MRLTVALVATALCVGCTTLGPDYREPEVDWLVAWQPKLYGQLVEQSGLEQADASVEKALHLSHWWQRFNDPALNALIDSALAANPTLQIAGLRVLESRARLGGAEALRLPQSQQVEASAAYLRQRQRDGLLAASNSSFGNYSAAFTLGWELDFWGRFTRAIESADAAYLASIANQRDAQVLLVGQVADTYFKYRTTELRIAIALENASIQKRSFDITTQLFESGQESELDLQQARTQYLATLATIPDLERTQVQLRNAIGLLLGRPPTQIVELSYAKAELPAVDAVSLDAVPVELLMRRPDVRASAWQAGAQSAQIGIARADYYPAISLFGSFGWNGDSIGATSDGTTFAAGPSIRWNVFDYGRIRANILVQDVRLQQAIAAFDATVLQAAREIDDAAIAVAKTAEGQLVLEQSREAASRALDIANRRYKEGYADFQRVLDAQRSLFAQAEKELINQGAHASAVVSLYRALGGGWEESSMERMLPANVRASMRERSDWESMLEEDTTSLWQQSENP